MTGFLTPYIQDFGRRFDNASSSLTALLERIVARLDTLNYNVVNDEYADLHTRRFHVWNEADATLDSLVVPNGTTGFVEVLTGRMIAGAANVTLFVNGQYRLGGSVSAGGFVQTGGLLSTPILLLPGDVVTLAGTGFVATEFMEVYVQYRLSPIRPARATTAGAVEQAADRPNDQLDRTARRVSEGVFPGAYVRNGNPA